MSARKRIFLFILLSLRNKFTALGLNFRFHNKSEETNQKPAGGFLIAHFKRYIKKEKHVYSIFELHMRS